MNEFDQFAKHELKVKWYIRYTDDFAIISQNKQYLENLLPIIQKFLFVKLRLELHPKKVEIRKLNQGIDFLGHVIFPYHKILRAKTRKRIFKKINRGIKECKSGLKSKESLNQSLQSYLGVISHSNGYKLSQKLKNDSWFKLNE